MKMFVRAVALLAACAAPLAAQTRSTLEIRPFVGVSVPTGEQHAIFARSPLVGVQGALELRPELHLVGTISWSPALTRLASSNDHVNVFSQELGLEALLPRPLSASWTLKPFLGGGIGVRNYLYRAQEFKSRGGPLGYGSIGSELEHRAIALRLEARGNLFRYRSPESGGVKEVRNDVTVVLGVAYHLR